MMKQSLFFAGRFNFNQIIKEEIIRITTVDPMNRNELFELIWSSSLSVRLYFLKAQSTFSIKDFSEDEYFSLLKLTLTKIVMVDSCSG